ncbi:unnamed protein product [Symbiodinium natans]|uniref:Uncharacterized protein n=1 Tax=Symbiodinium natans TaxID=878477 RepID=A0A812Q733_9DINO|nr:unnamed protein product [Symbiodinium natans]
MKISVFIPTKMRILIERYRNAGVPVHALEAPVDRFPKVRAILHEDGSGDVRLSDPCFPYDNSAQMSACNNFLQDLGYVAQGCREFLVHATAKFWLSNQLGPLTVFPQQIAIEEVYRILQHDTGKKWQRYTHDMVLLLPVTAVGGPTKSQLNKFGSGLARRLFLGGGPCMLQDSKNLVRRALNRLGYMDGDMNADLSEAMLVFVNIPDNQYALRKQLDALPSQEDTTAEVESKLRHAFLSHLTHGQWRIAPKDAQVRQVLYKLGFLPTTKASTTDVFDAMARYARQHHLPEMKTYNGRVFRILYSLDSSPTKTGTLELSP